MSPAINPQIPNAAPPFVAVEYTKGGFAGVENTSGVNCLTFSGKPGAVFTDIETARAIAAQWNLCAAKRKQ